MEYYKPVINFVSRPKIVYQIELPPVENQLRNEPHFVFPGKDINYTKSGYMEKFPSMSSGQYQQCLELYAINSYKRSEEIKKTMQTMFFYENDKIFHKDRCA